MIEGVKAYTFNSTVNSYTINIPIINDDVFEVNEQLHIGLKNIDSVPLGIFIETENATITIVDDDCELIPCMHVHVFKLVC